MAGGRPWTSVELEVLERIGTHGAIAEQLPGRSRNAVAHKRQELGITGKSRIRKPIERCAFQWEPEIELHARIGRAAELCGLTRSGFARMVFLAAVEAVEKAGGSLTVTKAAAAE